MNLASRSPQHLVRTKQQLAGILEKHHSAGPRNGMSCCFPTICGIRTPIYNCHGWRNSSTPIALPFMAVLIHRLIRRRRKTFLTREPHVDFIVAGEGEETLKELLGALALGGSETVHVNGLRFLSNGTFVETAPRLRAPDVNRFPSPYLTGFFDNWKRE